jgi:hypothetical protein
MEGLFRLQEVMSVQRKREKTPQVRSLKGMAQLQNDERAELLWANGVFKERVVPATAAQTLGFCVFARNYDEFQLKEFLLKLTYRVLLPPLRPSSSRAFVRSSLSPPYPKSSGWSFPAGGRISTCRMGTSTTDTSTATSRGTSYPNTPNCPCWSPSGLLSRTTPSNPPTAS